MIRIVLSSESKGKKSIFPPVGILLLIDSGKCAVLGIRSEFGLLLGSLLNPCSLCFEQQTYVREYVMYKSSRTLTSFVSFTQDICKLVN